MTFYVFLRHRVCLVDHVDLIYSWYSCGKVLGLPPHCPWVSIVVLFPPLHVGHPLRFVPVRAKFGGGAAAWVAWVLAAPGTQGIWQLGQQEI